MKKSPPGSRSWQRSTPVERACAHCQGSLPGENILRVWKQRGETLAALLRRVREERGIAPQEKLTYAGRLDPMAEGEVLLLTGAARFEKERYIGLSKTYRFEVLLGVSTDTYDTLGIITNTQIPIIKEVTQETITEEMGKLKNEKLPYPPFSSKPIDGVPLFTKAKEGTLPDNLPMQRSAADDIVFLKSREVSCGELAQTIIADIKKVEGDFRQKAIIEGWRSLMNDPCATSLQLLSFETTVPSGVYIRSIAHEIGKRLGIPTLAHRIIRTKIHE